MAGRPSSTASLAASTLTTTSSVTTSSGGGGRRTRLRRRRQATKPARPFPPPAPRACGPPRRGPRPMTRVTPLPPRASRRRIRGGAGRANTAASPGMSTARSGADP
eukprot:1700510-Pyramimonas_sp.AAC.1